PCQFNPLIPNADRPGSPLPRSGPRVAPYLDLSVRPQYIAATCCRPVLTDIRRGFENPLNIEPAWRLTLQDKRDGRWRAVLYSFSRLTTDADTNDGAQPVQIPAGSALGDQQGHLAAPPRDDDHHDHGVRDGGSGIDFLLRRGSDY